MDLSCEVLILFTRRFEDDFRIGEEVMAREIDFPERAFANEFPEGVVTDVSEVFGGEFSAPIRRWTNSSRIRKPTEAVRCMSLRAVDRMSVSAAFSGHFRRTLAFCCWISALVLEACMPSEWSGREQARCQHPLRLGM